MKIVGQRIPQGPQDYLRAGALLHRSLERWNPFPRPRGKVFRFRTWEEVERWREMQTNPRFR